MSIGQGLHTHYTTFEDMVASEAFTLGFLHYRMGLSFPRTYECMSVRDQGRYERGRQLAAASNLPSLFSSSSLAKKRRKRPPLPSSEAVTLYKSLRQSEVIR